MDPKNKDADSLEILKKISSNICDLNVDQKKKLGKFLVQYHDVIAKHCFDLGYNTKLKIELTLEHPLPVYVQDPSAPIHLHDEILIERALLRFLNFITMLSHSKYSSPIFAHRKSSCNRRIFIELGRVNHLPRHEYLISNFPFSKLTDNTTHFAAKNLFYKIDCSQAYHCVQMAEDLSVQVLASNFTSQTFA